MSSFGHTAEDSPQYQLPPSFSSLPPNFDHGADLPVTEIREWLQPLLDERERRLNLAGELGQRLLTQKVELTEIMNALNSVENPTPETVFSDPAEDLRRRLRNIHESLNAWNPEVEQLTGAINGGATNVNGLPPSSSINDSFSTFDTSFLDDAPSLVPRGPSAAQSARRARNAAPRANNVEFATEIGNSLTREIRRIQALLSERDKVIQDMKEERDDLERTLEQLRQALHDQQASAERFKDENWNLEFQNQELQTKLNDAEAASRTAENELKRTLKALNEARETVDYQRTEHDRLQTELDETREMHETEIATMRKTASAMERETTDLQVKVKELEVHVKKARATKPGFSPTTPAPQTPGYLDDEVFTGGDSRRKRDPSTYTPDFGDGYDSPLDLSPIKPPVTPGEAEALRGKLNHAHLQISSLKSSLQREKEQKLEYRKRLAEEAQAPMDWEDEEDLRAGGSPVSRSRSRVILGRGRGRGGHRPRGGKLPSLAIKLGMASAERARSSPMRHHMSTFTQDEEDEDVPEGFSPQKLPSMAEDDEPSPFLTSQPSRPTSIDGMDPAFANILRQAPSTGTISPLTPVEDSPPPVPRVRGGTFPRRKRGGGFPPLPRPPSFLEKPTALAAELEQLGDDATFDDETLLVASRPSPPRTAEIGVQVVPEPERVLTPPPPPPALVYSDATTQSEPERAPTPPPALVYSDATTQSEPERAPTPPPALVYSDATTQSEPERAPTPPPALVYLDATTQSEPERVPTPPPPPPALVYSDATTQSEPERVPTPPPPPPALVYLDATTQSEPERAPTPPPVLEYTGIAIQSEPEPISSPPPVILKSDASMQWESSPPPPTIIEVPVPISKPPTTDMWVQVEPEPVLLPPPIEYKQSSTQSDPEPVPVPRSMADMGTDPELEPVAVVVETTDAGMQWEPEPLPLVEHLDAAVQSDLSEEAPSPIIPVIPIIPSSPPRQLSEVAIQWEPEPIQRVDTAIQSDAEVLVIMPEPLPVREMADASMQSEPRAIKTSYVQTDEPPVRLVLDVAIGTEPAPMRADAGMSTVPEAKRSNMATSTPSEPLKAEMGVATDVVPQRPVADATMQTVERVTSEVEVQVDEPQVSFPSSSTVPIIIAPEPVHVLPPRAIALSTSSNVATPRASMYQRSVVARPVAMLFDDTLQPQAESETETEGQTEYEDAREPESSASTSVQDFHSFLNATTPSDSGQDFHSLQDTIESTDTESAASIRTVPRPALGETSGIAHLQHNSQAATHVPLPPLEESPAISRKELKEMAIQTDEWIPVPVSVQVPPPSPRAPAFQPVGSSQSTPFQYVPASPVKPPLAHIAPALAAAASVVRSPMRDSTATFGHPSRARTPSVISTDKYRPSMESFTSRDDDLPPASPSLAGLASSALVVDKTRPPTMMLPPPPSMPPPSVVPQKKHSVPPPRPTSPPPPELLQRATTPTFSRQNSLMVPSTRSGRQPAVSQGGLRQPISTSSFRSSSSPASRPLTRSGPPPSTYVEPVQDSRHPSQSQTSLLTASSVPSRRPSVSSSHSSQDKLAAPGTPGPNGMNSSTDPTVIHAITQTMIGEFLYKYTRRVVGKGTSDKRHKRFFWVHPYTKTLYWSSADPGASGAGESNAKSAYIDAVKSVIDPNPMPPGLYQYSIIVYTPQREMKFTAPTKERHDIWFKALSYLLDRPNTAPVASPAVGHIPASPRPPSRLRPNTPGEDGMLRGGSIQSPQSVRSARSNKSVDSWSLTPRARTQTNTSVGRRTGTPAAEYYRTYSDARSMGFSPEAQSPTRSIRSLQQRFRDAAIDDPDDEEDGFERVQTLPSGDFEIADDGEEFEGLENVRACCDGEHDLNHLAHGHHHHHHHHHNNNHSHRPTPSSIRPSSRMSNSRMDPASRPVSPSAWSFRSRGSREPSDGASLFSWGGGGTIGTEGGKRSIRFGSRRSNK